MHYFIFAAAALSVSQPSSVPRRAPQPPISSTPTTAAARKLDPPLLTAYIKQAKTLDNLLLQRKRHAASFNHIHCSAFWARAGQLRPNSADRRAFVPAIDLTLPFVESSFGRRELAGTAHGLARAGLGQTSEAQPLWTALATASAARLAEFTPRELSTVAWAFAKSQPRASATEQPAAEVQQLFDAIAEEAPRRLSGFTPQGLSNLAWAYASTGRAPPKLFSALAAHAAERADDLNCQEIANLGWAFAAVARPAPALFGALAAAARPRLSAATLDGFATRELAMLGWAFAVVDDAEAGEVLFGGDSPFARECEAALGAMDAAAWHARVGSVTQLHQWHLWRLERGGAWPGFSASFAARVRSAFFAEAEGPRFFFRGRGTQMIDNRKSK